MIPKFSPSVNPATLPVGGGRGKRNAFSKCVVHVIHPRKLPIREIHLDDIETPRDGSCAQPPQPFVRSAFDEPLFFPAHSIEGPDRCFRTTGFHFDEKQPFAVPCDDVDFTAAGTFEIAREDFDPVCTQPCRRGPFSVVADPFRFTERPVSRDQTAG